MQAGKLRHPIEIRERVVTRGPAGGEIEEDPILIKTVFGSVEPLSGDERVAAQQIHASASHRVRMRWNDDVEAESVLFHKGRRFEVLAVLDKDERETEMELTCAEAR